MKKANNIIFILIFIVFSILVLSLNIIINPFKEDLVHMRDCNRDLLYTAINKSKKDKFESVLIGGSGLLSVNYFDNFKKNMAISPLGVAPIELYDLLKYFLKFHPEVKKIYVSVEYNLYFTCFEKYTIPKKPTNGFNDFIKLYFSYDATIKSLQSVLKSIQLFTLTDKDEKAEENEDKETKADYEKYEDDKVIYSKNEDENDQIFYVYVPSLKFTYTSICEYDNMAVLKKIKDLINQHNIQAVYFIPPMHALYLSDNVKAGCLSTIEKYKKELTEITPYWDMSFINSYTTVKPIGGLFYDVYHANGDFFSKKILNILNGTEIDDSMAVYITKNNVDKVLKKQHSLIYDYIKNNKKIVNYHYKHEFDNKVKKTYLKDLPKKLQKMYYENL